MDIALVPARFGKTRLRTVLTADQRRALQAAMLDDVLAALAGSSVDRVVVAAGDVDVAGHARLSGIEVLTDPRGAGLNEAIEAATTALAARRDVGILVVAADLPTLTSAEVDRILAAGPGVVVAPTDDGGTGALLRRPAGAIRASYGLASAGRHAAAARAAGVRLEELLLPGTSLDVDTPDDLLRAATSDRLGARTRAVLDEVAPSTP